MNSFDKPAREAHVISSLSGKNDSNDSLEQKREKAHNQGIKSDNQFGNKRTDGPNHPST